MLILSVLPVLILLILVVVLIVLRRRPSLPLSAAVLVFRQQLLNLSDEFQSFLLFGRQNLFAAFNLQLLKFGGERGDLRLVLGGERRLVGVRLSLLLVSLRPRRELGAESAGVIKRVMLPRTAVERLHVKPGVGLAYQILAHRRRRHRRQFKKTRKIVLDVGNGRIRISVKIGKLLGKLLRLRLRRFDLRHYRRCLLLVGDGLGYRLPDGNPDIGERFGAFRKRIGKRYRPFRRVGPVRSGLRH